MALGMLADPGTLDALHVRVLEHRAGQASMDDEPERVTPGPVPATVLHVHLDRSVATWAVDGGGALTRAEAQDLVGHSQVTIRPALDLAADLSYPGYVAPPTCLTRGMWRRRCCASSSRC